MNLPPRREGPHAWLWRLLYREAGQLLSRSATPGNPDEAAEWLWRGIASGWIWIRRDREGISWVEPDRWLHELVTAEAARHLALGDSRMSVESGSEAGPAIEPEAAGPTVAGSGRPRAERQAVIAGHIWRYLSTGWARVADNEDAVLFWHPAKRQFLPFTADLEADYRRLFRSMRNVGAQTERRIAEGQPYTGRQRARGVPEGRGAYTGAGARHRMQPRPETAGDSQTERPEQGTDRSD